MFAIRDERDYIVQEDLVKVWMFESYPPKIYNL